MSLFERMALLNTIQKYTNKSLAIKTLSELVYNLFT